MMKIYKKAIAAICSFVLAFALMVPTVSLADDNVLQLRMTYNNEPIVISDLAKVPRTAAVTFSVNVDYPGFADLPKTISFDLSSALTTLRIAQVDESNGVYTVIVSNGNEPLPLTDESYLDLGNINVHVDTNLDLKSKDLAAMRIATINVFSLQTSDEEEITNNTIGEGSEVPDKKIAFALANSSFSKTQGDPNSYPLPPIAEEIDTTMDEGVTPPGNAEVLDAANPIVAAALNKLFNGEMPEGIAPADVDALRLFVAEVMAAGYSVEQLQLQYAVEALNYTALTEVPKGDRELLEALADANKGKIDSLVGYYNLGVKAVISVPETPPEGISNEGLTSPSVAASLLYTAEPVEFSVEAPAGALEGKGAAVFYVHEGAAKILEGDIAADSTNSKITFKASEFSTYAAYTASKGAKFEYPKGDTEKATASQPTNNGGGINPIIIILIVAIIIAALGGGYVFMRKRNAATNYTNDATSDYVDDDEDDDQ